MVKRSWVNSGLGRMLFCTVSQCYMYTVVFQVPSSSSSSSTLPLTFIGFNQAATKLKSKMDITQMLSLSPKDLTDLVHQKFT